MKRLTTILVLLCTFVLTAVADELPYKTTTIKGGKFADDTEWYCIKIGSYYLMCGERNNLALARETDFNDDAYLWCFEGNSKKFHLYNKKKGADAALGHEGIFEPGQEAYSCTFTSKGSTFYYNKSKGIYIKNFLIQEYLNIRSSYVCFTPGESSFTAQTASDFKKQEEVKKQREEARKNEEQKKITAQQEKERQERMAKYEPPFSITTDEFLRRLYSDFVKNNKLTPIEYVGAYSIEYRPKQYDDGISIQVFANNKSDYVSIAVFKKPNWYQIKVPKIYNRALVKNIFENAKLDGNGFSPIVTLYLKEDMTLYAEDFFGKNVKITNFKTKNGQIGQFWGTVELPSGSQIMKLTSIDEIKIKEGLVSDMNGTYRYETGEKVSDEEVQRLTQAYHQDIVNRQEAAQRDKSEKAKKESYDKMIKTVGKANYDKLMHNQIPIGISYDQLNAYANHVNKFYALSEHHIGFESISYSGDSSTQDIWLYNEDGRGGTDMSLYRVYFQNHKAVHVSQLHF